MSCSKAQYLALMRKFGQKQPTKQPRKRDPHGSKLKDAKPPTSVERKTTKPIIEEEITEVTSDLSAVGFKPLPNIDDWLGIVEREIAKKPITEEQTAEELPEELPQEQTAEELPEELPQEQTAEEQLNKSLKNKQLKTPRVLSKAKNKLRSI